MQILDMSITSLHRHYRDGRLTPADVVDYILSVCQDYTDHHIWIKLLSSQQIMPYLARLKGVPVDSLPLYGIPFAIKDNIDLAGVPTTAACPQFSYIPEQSAFVVQQLIDAGAIPIGKTNMDQFATGLTGTRSPYGTVKNSINADYISGGSSSGSAVATALGLVSFALGTDTAGSGRVPAMFNNLIGVKPSCGIVSTRGVVPACRSIDCVSLFALNPDDAACIYPVMARYDEQDSYARMPEQNTKRVNTNFRFGIVPQAQLQADAVEIHSLMEQMTGRLVALGGTAVPIDFTPFQQAANLLYEGPWVAERYTTIEKLIASSPESEVLYPITKAILSRADKFSAADTFRAMYRLRDLKRLADNVLSGVDFIVTPTASNIFTIQAVENDPIGLNTLLGYYTNFVNLLDYSAIALPAGRLANDLPFGVTLFADKFHDDYLLRMSRRILAQSGLSMGATGFSWVPDNSVAAQVDKDRVNLLVCGAHLTGMPLNHQLINLDAELVQSTTTAPFYRLYSLAGGPPFRPGLVKDRNNGTSIAVEIWSMPVMNLGRFLQGIPAPLGLGKVELADNTEVIGFICEPYAVNAATDITEFGGWVKYIQTLKNDTKKPA